MGYLSKMTVKSLKEIADRMDVPYPYRVLKADLIDRIEQQISRDYDRAVEDDQYIDSLHTDSPLVIDTEEFPMDHKQFTVWYNRHGGIDSFNVKRALNSDHSEALEMNKPTFLIPGSDITITDPASVFILGIHYKALMRYNPTLKRDGKGQVILTPAQRRRLHKRDRKAMKKAEALFV